MKALCFHEWLMEIQFQEESPRPSKMRGSRNKGMQHGGIGNKYIGVRQRPSGRWVAEIKDTTQKIRMWLGTFESAEEAARAYDQAACLLRGSNTRTNFVTQLPTPNSPLASRIRNLLHTKKRTKDKQQQIRRQDQSSSCSDQAMLHSASTSTTPTPASTTSKSTQQEYCCTQLQLDDVYKPDLSNCINNQHTCFSFSQDLLDLPNNNLIPSDTSHLSDFDLIKVERQISASLYAINGLHQYMETVYDPTEPLWDLPPLCSLFT